MPKRAEQPTPDSEHAARRVTVTLDPIPESLHSGRRTVDAFLADAGETREELRHSLWLVVTELLTNSIVHGSSAGSITLELVLHPGYVRVRVHNYGRGIALTTLRSDHAEGGRGLDIIAALSERWTIDSSSTGTTVAVNVPVRAT